MSQHHDPVHPDSDHLTPEVLADLDMGLLDEASATSARHHLEHCALCTALHDDLATLTETLQSLSSPDHDSDDPMPDAVWQQVSAALAAEPVLTPEGSATVVPMQPRKRRGFRPSIGVVAGAAGIALVGAIGFSAIQTSGSGNDAATLNDGGAGAMPETTRSPVAADFQATRSGTQYSEADLDQQVTALVAARTSYSTTDGTQDDEAASPAPSGSLTASATASPSFTDKAPSGGLEGARWLKTAGPMATDPAAAQACLEGYLDFTGIAPLAIDIGTWQGKPAAVIVLPLDATMAQVYVINPTCDATGTANPLYYYASINR